MSQREHPSASVTQHQQREYGSVRCPVHGDQDLKSCCSRVWLDLQLASCMTNRTFPIDVLAALLCSDGGVPTRIPAIRDAALAQLAPWCNQSRRRRHSHTACSQLRRRRFTNSTPRQTCCASGESCMLLWARAPCLPSVCSVFLPPASQRAEWVRHCMGAQHRSAAGGGRAGR